MTPLETDRTPQRMGTAADSECAPVDQPPVTHTGKASESAANPIVRSWEEIDAATDDPA